MARNKIEAEVTGRIWKIEKALHDALAADDVILIIESMKMEIPVLSMASGRLVEILVAEGEAVETGQVVAIVEV